MKHKSFFFVVVDLGITSHLCSSFVLRCTVVLHFLLVRLPCVTHGKLKLEDDIVMLCSLLVAALRCPFE